MFDSWVECPDEQVTATRQRSPLIRRSRQAAGLARALSERTGRPVDLTYDGSGWRVSWVDGPTTVEMRALVAEHTPIHAPDLPAEDLGFERGDTDLGVAVQILTWLAADYPDRADGGPVDLWLFLRSGRDLLPGSPEPADPAITTRARTLIAAGWSPATHTATAVGSALEDHARDGGWPAVASWLDELSRLARPHRDRASLPGPPRPPRSEPGAEASPVADLDAHRRRRQRRS